MSIKSTIKYFGSLGFGLFSLVGLLYTLVTDYAPGLSNTAHARNFGLFVCPCRVAGDLVVGSNLVHHEALQTTSENA